MLYIVSYPNIPGSGSHLRRKQKRLITLSVLLGENVPPVLHTNIILEKVLGGYCSPVPCTLISTQWKP